MYIMCVYICTYVYTSTNVFEFIFNIFASIINAAAAAAAKSLQSCPILCDPIDVSPPGSPVPRCFSIRSHKKLLAADISFFKPLPPSQ